MALSTSSADTWRGVSWLVMDAGGMSMSGWGTGCLSLRAERVSSSRSLMMSLEEARQTAPLKSPSLSSCHVPSSQIIFYYIPPCRYIYIYIVCTVSNTVLHC